MAADDATQEVFVFELSEEEYGIPVEKVEEIVRVEELEITRIPNAPPFIRGITNVRGKVVPLIDLEERFGLEKQENRFIVLIDIQGTTAGILVDDVHEVMRISTARIKDAPDILKDEIHSEYVKEVAVLEDRMIIILDLEAGLSASEATKVGDLGGEQEEDEEEIEEVTEEEVEERVRERVGDG